jgi:two-component system, LytTR family, sensor kinase
MSRQMGAPGWRRFVRWVVVAAGVCLALALLDTAVIAIDARTDPRMGLKLSEEPLWFTLFYLMWAALTPAIFASARRVPVTRERWRAPVAFHLVASLVVSATASTLLYFLFCALYRGMPLSDLLGPAMSYWADVAASRAMIDPLTYWMILAAGFALHAFDTNRERERNAAELRRALVASQVEALKMKLQPHFLFNTLNSISFLAVEKDVDGVVSMVDRLAALLRSSMQVAGSQLVSVREELALADQYLAIEEIRFTDRLHVSRRIAPGATDALIPSLVLQPMIENSIKHGFSRRIDASRIDIAIRRDGDALVVTVEDDGPGVPPGWDLATHCGRGLKNVIERLDKLYPGDWAFTLRNQAQGGAIARLRIPWQDQSGATPEALPVAGDLAPAGL